MVVSRVVGSSEEAGLAESSSKANNTSDANIKKLQ